MSDRPKTILVVDDDPELRHLLSMSLSVQGYDVREAATAKEALQLATVAKFDLIVLDLGLPDMDGADLLAALREWSQTPIFILSVRGFESDKVKALELGADDYITKPFGMAEFVARIRGALRRTSAILPQEPIFNLGGLSVDLNRRIVRLNGTDVHLSPKQYRLLQVLLRNAGKVVTHGQLLQEIWGTSNTKDVQYLRVFVRELRSKIEPEPARPRYLLTELGVGYRLASPDQFVEAPEPPAGSAV